MADKTKKLRMPGVFVMAPGSSNEKTVTEMEAALDLINGLARGGLKSPQIFHRLLLAIRLMHSAAPAEVRGIIEEQMREALALLYVQPPVERKESEP